jgi:hypothetical protein
MLTVGAVGEIGGTEVSMNVARGRPLTEAAMVNAPVAAPKVTRTPAMPLGSVIAEGEESVAAEDGTTTKLTMTPDRAVPVESVTRTVTG